MAFLKSEFFISIVSVFVASLNRNSRLVDDVASQFKILIVFGLLLNNRLDNSTLQETLTSSTIVLSKSIFVTTLSVGIESVYSLLGSEYDKVSWVESEYVTVNTFALATDGDVVNLIVLVIPPPPLCL